MEYLKTKEAAAALGVSPTTVKRWASTKPERFRKDASGHYIFLPEDLSVLASVKGTGEPVDAAGDPAPLPVPAVRLGQAREPEGPRSAVPPGWEELTDRLRELERGLDRKAGEVVTYQILEHRRELDELRASVRELACSLDSLAETLQQPGAAKAAAPGMERSPVRRKSWLGTLL
jgi:chromosome-anchoring protein RacA